MSKVKLKIIGCGDAFGSGGNLNTCFFLETAHTRLLIDCGASVLSGLKKYKIDPDQIDTILVSHFHGDHYGGIPFFLMAAAASGRKNKLTIITPKNGEARIKALLELLYPGSEKTNKLFIDYIEYQAFGVMETQLFKLTAFPVVHSKTALSHGLRLEIEQKTISYSGDTSWTDALIDLSRDADLFICECTFFSEEMVSHMNYLTLSQHLHLLNYKRILLTHLGEEMLNNIEKIKLDHAKDGMEINI